MVQLNLLPDVKKAYLRSQKTKAVVISSSILITLSAAAVAVLLFMYVTFGQALQISIITGDIKRKAQEVANVQDVDKYLTIQNQLKALPELHDQKGLSSRLFDFLPILNPGPPNNVKLSVLNMSTADRTILLNGNTSTFESLKVFVDTLSNAQISYKELGSNDTKTDTMFETVAVQSSSLGRLNNVSSVSFTLRLVYKEALFDARNSDIQASVPNIQTTQSLTNAPKPQLFEGEAQ